MKTLLNLLTPLISAGIILAAAAIAFSNPAAAQVAGTYAGTSADGSGIMLAVSTDTATGKLAVTSASIGFMTTCSDGSTYNSGWGFGPTNDIVKHKVKSVNTNAYFTIIFDLTFATDGQSATGTISTVTPNLAPIGPKPTKAVVCKSPSQALNLTLQPAAIATHPAAPAATAYLFDRKGRIIGSIAR